MICHEKKCIFIHIPGAGGSSIEKAITGRDWWHVEDPSTWETPEYDTVSNPHTSILKHMCVDEAKKVYFDYWRDYFKFTIVRNPYELIFVNYWKLKHVLGGIDFDTFVKMLQHDCTLERFHDTWTWSTKWLIPQTRWLTPICRYWMSSQNSYDEIPMINNMWKDKGDDEHGCWPDRKNSFNQYINDIHVIRFEDIQEGFADLSKSQNWNIDKLPHLNKNPNRPDWKSMYTPRAIQIISHLYREDFAYLNYSTI